MAGTTLDVAIGLIFIFMLFSVFLSTVLEAVASALKLRARALEITIAQLIQDPGAIPFAVNWPAKGLFGLFDGLHKLKERVRIAAGGLPAVQQGDKVDPAHPERFEGPTEGPEDITANSPLRFADVYEHPLVGAIPGRRPSYVPAKNFTSALLYAVGGGNEGSLQTDLENGIAALPQGAMRTALTTALHEAEGDMQKLREGVERWYDNAMDRLSGEYKRFSQAATFLLALVLAAVFQIDSIAIAQRLYADSALRETIAALATHYIDDHATGPTRATTPAIEGPAASDGATGPTPSAAAAASPMAVPGASPAPVAPATSAAQSSPTPAKDSDQASDGLVTRIEAVRRAQRDLFAPLILVKPDMIGSAKTVKPGEKNPKRTWLDWGAMWWAMLPGILVTALAGMLGAPFWFEVLQRLVNLRGSGPKPIEKAGK